VQFTGQELAGRGVWSGVKEKRKEKSNITEIVHSVNCELKMMKQLKTGH
jgi:hypothetical protein